MNQFERIYEELESLGWKAKRGRGDHVKFFKEGQTRPITISMNLNEASRSYQNTLANIRLVEPGFSIGRPARKKEEVTEEAAPRPEGLPDFIDIGKPVRYTAPEGRDWRKLKSNLSVMSHMYEVESINGDRIFIRQHPSGTTAFAVGKNDLDSWELSRCPRCGKEIPASVIVQDPYGNEAICPECAKDRMAERKAAEVKETRRRKTEKTEETTGTAGLTVPLENEDKKWDTERISKLLGDETQEEGKRLTPYEAWKKTLETIQTIEILRQKREFSDKKESDKILDNLKRSSGYDLSSIRIPGQKKYSRVIRIKTPDMETALKIWRQRDEITSLFQETAEDDTFILLTEQSSGMRQYLTYNDDGNGFDRLKRLKGALEGREDEDCLERARRDLSLTPGPWFREEIDALLERFNRQREKKGLKTFPTEKTYVLIHHDIRKKDEDNFLEAKPFYSVRIIFVTEDEADQGFLDDFSEFAGEAKGFSAPTVISPVMLTTKLDTIYGKEITHIDDDYFETPESNDGKDNRVYRTNTILSIFWKPLTDSHEILYASPDNPEEKEPIKKAVREALKELALAKPGTRSECVSEAINELVADLGAGRVTDPLDSPNPSSSNPKTAGLSTREIIRELKGRGAAFRDLKITVTRDIDPDTI